jgi:hypothetical protein
MDLTSVLLIVKMLSFLVFAHDLVAPPPPRPVIEQQVQVQTTTVEIIYKDDIILPEGKR